MHPRAAIVYHNPVCAAAACCRMQTLWKPPPVRRDESLRCLFWYALLYLVPTGKRCQRCNLQLLCTAMFGVMC
jgi:hypothetical protein